MEENGSINSPWKTLTTRTTFDRGSSSRSTAPVRDTASRQSKGQVVSYNLSASLCIESLLQQLCAMVGGDAHQKQQVYTVVCNKLRKLNVIDDSYNMVEFESLRFQYHDALCRLIKVAYAAIANEGPRQLTSIVLPEWSRYSQEFREVCFIAEGGFGYVCKAVHCLDGVEYAIKKISVESNRIQCLERHLQEVKTLARLNHTNIVSYKSAWIEYALPAALSTSVLPEEAAGPSIMIQSSPSVTTESECSDIVFCARPNCDVGGRENRLEIGERNGHSNTRCTRSGSVREDGSVSVTRDEDSGEESKEDNSEGNAEEGFSYRSNSSDTDYDSNEENNMQVCRFVRPQPKGTYATLYIQMSLCEKTLEQWLEERIEPIPEEVIVNVFTQIVQGLDHIHARQIVHHDIKPSNIFISTTGTLQVQLGDFGLACPLQRESHADAFGTYLYAAPEQLARKCDPKSDIYSVGIVLLDLLVQIRTSMERCQLIQGLKEEKVPDAVKANYPKWVDILLKLVQQEPSKRPSSRELLNMINEDKDATIQELMQNVAMMRNTITMLESQLSECKEKATLSRENSES